MNDRVGADITRRHWLGNTLRSVLLGGNWWLGVDALAEPASASADSAPDSSPSQAPASPPRGLSPWLRLNADGRVTAFTNVSDLGQGTWTALQAAVAHELAVPFESVDMQAAPVEPAYRNPWIDNYATFGSLGLGSGLETLRPAAASARDSLLRAAAARWAVAPSVLRAEDAKIWHGTRAIAYRDLLADAARLPTPHRPAQLRAEPPPPPPRRQHAGRRVGGRLRYGIDVRLDGQVHAATQRGPGFGAQLLGIDNEAEVGRMPGVLRIVRLPLSVAVVARGTWQAMQAAAALRLRWVPAQAALPDSDSFRLALRDAASRGDGVTLTSPREPAFDAAATARALASAAQTVDLLFDVPFLAHAPMEPLNATVRVTSDAVDIWVSTQSGLDTRNAVARLLKRPPEQVRVHPQVAGGGFGRRLEHDWVLEAAQVAAELPGTPVQLVWTREVEFKAGRYRPAVAARLRLALGADGGLLAIRADLANPSLLEYTGVTNGPRDIPDWTTAMGWRRQPYAVPALHLTWARVDAGVPCAYWRSVGASQNHFFYECALDVAARRSGQSPTALRERLLAKHPRGLAFLHALLAHGRWSAPLAPGHHRGLAIAAANGSLSGHVVELKVLGAGRFRLVDIAAAIDAGRVHDPSAVDAQLAGGTVFGLSAALAGEVRMEGGTVVQGNFHDYPVVRMSQLPPVRVLLVASDAEPGGVGEEGVPTIAPAIANALYAASGEPITRLPLSRAGWVQDS
jgi:isoquinoline 1-oxidoreductase beta subunit